VVLTVPDLPRFTLSSIFGEWGLDPFLFVVTVWIVGL
jgi:hypothetical protein